MEAPDQGSLAVATGQTRARLLVADDDEDFRQLVALTLRSAGYEVVAVGNGAELLRAMEVNNDEPRPAAAFDAVIADVRMPGASGLSIAEGLAADGWRDRVLLMSAFADAELSARARRSGAWTLLAKPFPMVELIFEVRALLGQR